MTSDRDDRTGRISLPAGMELVVPPPARDERERGGPRTTGPVRGDRIGVVPRLVGDRSRPARAERAA